jgi:type II secretory pathway pseudopilin PulG
MKKKYWFLVGLVILVIAMAAPSAFGAITAGEQKATEQQSQQSSDQMLDWHRQWLEQAQNEGRLTPEQAKTWQEHFDEMRDFHRENGLGPMNGMMNSRPEGSHGTHCSGSMPSEGDTKQI